MPKKTRKQPPANLIPIVTVDPLPIRRVISGGQTGADQAGLEAAVAVRLKTGGWAPKGFKTEAGPNPKLADFGLREHSSSDYPPRTEANVKRGDITIIVSTTWKLGIGSRLTEKLCRKHGKPVFLYTKLDKETAILSAEGLYRSLPYIVQNTAGRKCYLKARDRKGWIINIAGPRESSQPGIQKKARIFLRAFFKRFKEMSQPAEQVLPAGIREIVGK